MPIKGPLLMLGILFFAFSLSCRVSQEKVDLGGATFCDQLRARLSAAVLVNEAMTGIYSTPGLEELDREVQRFVSEVFGDREGGTLEDLKELRAGSNAAKQTCHYALRDMELSDGGSLTLDMFRIWQLSQSREMSDPDAFQF